MMKISTAEIKILIKECIKTGGVFTAENFGNYIRNNSDKQFTRGQLSGALAQLVDNGDIVRVSRGLYSKDSMTMVTKNLLVREETKSVFKQSTYRMLKNVETELAKVVSDTDVWKLEKDDFEILSKVCGLKEHIEEVMRLCK